MSAKFSGFPWALEIGSRVSGASPKLTVKSRISCILHCEVQDDLELLLLPPES